MDPIFEFIKELVDKFGLFAALLAFAGFNYVLIVRSQQKSDEKRKNSETERDNADTEQQKVITAQFKELSDENRALRSRLDNMEAEQRQAHVDRATLSTQLDTYKKLADEQKIQIADALVKSTRADLEIKVLSEKVMVLESIRATQENALARERTDAETLKNSLRNSNEQISQLRERVSALEAENKLLREIFSDVKIVAIQATPDAKIPESPDGTSQTVGVAVDVGVETSQKKD